MSVVLSLYAALAAGTSDFLGGFTSRRAPALLVAAVTHGLGVLAMLVIASIAGGDPTRADMVWGAVSGVGGALGLLVLYQGYAVSRVSIVAPVAGVGAASVPVLVGIATGDDLTLAVGTGIGLGLVAIALVSLQQGDQDVSAIAGLAYGLGGAAGLGLLLLGLGQVSDDGGVWVVVPSRMAGFVVLAVLVTVTPTSWRVPQSTVTPMLAMAVLASSANAAYAAATQLGSLSTAAVVTAMFPAVTVVWARFVFQERLRTVQIIGLVLAMVSVALIAAG